MNNAQDLSDQNDMWAYRLISTSHKVEIPVILIEVMLIMCKVTMSATPRLSLIKRISTSKNSCGYLTWLMQFSKTYNIF